MLPGIGCMGDGEEAQLIPVLARVLSHMVRRNDEVPLDAAGVTPFHALRPPAISIDRYLERLFKYAACSSECFIVALVYMDRLIQRNRGVRLSSLNVHRLLVTAVMLAAKFCEDSYYNNAYYAKVGGVPPVEMNALELEFLFLINFSLNVSPEEFVQYKRELLLHADSGDAEAMGRVVRAVPCVSEMVQHSPATTSAANMAMDVAAPVPEQQYQQGQQGQQQQHGGQQQMQYDTSFPSAYHAPNTSSVAVAYAPHHTQHPGEGGRGAETVALDSPAADTPTDGPPHLLPYYFARDWMDEQHPPPTRTTSTSSAISDFTDQPLPITPPRDRISTQGTSNNHDNNNHSNGDGDGFGFHQQHQQHQHHQQQHHMNMERRLDEVLPRGVAFDCGFGFPAEWSASSSKATRRHVDNLDCSSNSNIHSDSLSPSVSAEGSAATPEYLSSPAAWPAAESSASESFFRGTIPKQQQQDGQQQDAPYAQYSYFSSAPRAAESTLTQLLQALQPPSPPVDDVHDRRHPAGPAAPLFA